MIWSRISMMTIFRVCLGPRPAVCGALWNVGVSRVVCYLQRLVLHVWTNSCTLRAHSCACAHTHTPLLNHSLDSLNSHNHPNSRSVTPQLSFINHSLTQRLNCSPIHLQNHSHHLSVAHTIRHSITVPNCLLSHSFIHSLARSLLPFLQHLHAVVITCMPLLSQERGSQARSPMRKGLDSKLAQLEKSHSAT